MALSVDKEFAAGQGRAGTAGGRGDKAISPGLCMSGAGRHATTQSGLARQRRLGTHVVLIDLLSLFLWVGDNETRHDWPDTSGRR